MYSKYLKYLDENNLIDSAQIWTSALEVLNLNQDWGKNYNLIFTGFLSFNHGQFELLQALNARCENLIILKPEAYLNNFHDVNEQFEIINIGSQNKKSSGKIIEIPAPEPGLEPEILARNLALWSQNKGPFNEFLKFSGFDSIGIMTQNGREWMTLLPNEIITQRLPIKKTRGKVLTYGLGLGYYAVMCALKPEVSSVTVVERDENVISLFKDLILPRFDCGDKIAVVTADAFDYARNTAPKESFDYIFADIWHDPTDGVELYKKFKSLEIDKHAQYDYWIEDTLKLYM